MGKDKNDKLDLKLLQRKVSKAVQEAGQQLEGVGKDTKEFMKRGEDELAKISRMGRAQFEIMALSVKKEQLYRQIGMKVWQLSTQGKLTTNKLKTFCEELSAVNKKVKARKRAMHKTMKR